MDVRTDLALELHEDALKNSVNNNIPGAYVEEKEYPECLLTEIKIINEEGAKVIGSPCGNYTTFEVGRVGISETKKFCSVCERVTEKLTEYAEHLCKGKPDKILVAGLGNADITADSLGPLAIKSVLVTAHLKRLSKELFESFGSVEITALSMGVMAQTGIESAKIIKSVCDTVKPKLVIAIDSLASNIFSRLATTVQITDTGICPGSGIGNKRNAVTKKEIGVPVIGIGVPTMIEIAELICDGAAAMGDAYGTDEVRAKLGDKSKQLVTPKDSAIMIADMAKLIGFAIDRSFIKDINYDEIARLVN